MLEFERAAIKIISNEADNKTIYLIGNDDLQTVYCFLFLSNWVGVAIMYA